jgi:hypothetical protein
MTDNLPVPDDLPHLNLSQSEVEELRDKKHELTEYGKQKLRELMNKDLIFYTNGKETSRIPSPTLENLTLGTKAPEIKLEIKMTKPIEAKVTEEDFNKIVDAFNNPQPYPDEMFEEAERREKLNAGFKQDADGNWYRPTLQELTRNERIELAEKEIAYIVMGGQDGREYANSIAFILQVLDSLRDD